MVKHVYNGVLISTGTATNKALNAIVDTSVVLTADQALNQLTTIVSTGPMQIGLPTATDIVTSQNAAVGDIFEMEYVVINAAFPTAIITNTGITLGYALVTLTTNGRKVSLFRVTAIGSSPAVTFYQ